MRHLVTYCLAAALALLPGAAWAEADIPPDVAEKIAQLNRVQGEGGWQAYADLNFQMGNSPDGAHVDWRFEAGHGEMKATVHVPDGEPVTQFVIPFGVYMSRGLSEKQARSPDALEFTGLQGQFVLLLLEQAFPDGPDGVKKAETRTVTEKTEDHEIRFLGGVMEVHPAWEATVTAGRGTDGRIDFELAYRLLDDDSAHLHAKGTWKAGPGDWVLPDAEPLEGWAVNYFGATSVGTGGAPHFESPLGDTSAFTTLGDVRKAAAHAKVR
jgi:hypothetical protein